jgi:hypothetical protein
MCELSWKAFHKIKSLNTVRRPFYCVLLKLMHDWEVVSIHLHILSKFKVYMMLGVKSKICRAVSLSVRNEWASINATHYELIHNYITFIRKVLLHKVIIMLK